MNATEIVCKEHNKIILDKGENKMNNDYRMKKIKEALNKIEKCHLEALEVFLYDIVSSAPNYPEHLQEGTFSKAGVDNVRGYLTCLRKCSIISDDEMARLKSFLRFQPMDFYNEVVSVLENLSDVKND